MRINKAKLEAVLSKFSASSAHLKKPPKTSFVQSKKPPDARIDKNEKERRWMKLQAEAREHRYTQYEEAHEPFKRWRAFLRRELKDMDVAVDEFGRVDVDYLGTADDLDLSALPVEVRKGCLELYGKFVSSVQHKLQGPEHDPTIVLAVPVPDDYTGTDYDEMRAHLF